jgi:hypothetical protein
MHHAVAEQLVAERRARDLADAATHRLAHRARPAAQRHHFHLMSLAASWSRSVRPVRPATLVDCAPCPA